MKKSEDTQKEQKNKEKKPLTKPGDINGKLDVCDTRERRDGPGGN